MEMFFMIIAVAWLARRFLFRRGRGMWFGSGMWGMRSPPMGGRGFGPHDMGGFGGPGMGGHGPGGPGGFGGHGPGRF